MARLFILLATGIRIARPPERKDARNEDAHDGQHEGGYEADLENGWEYSSILRITTTETTRKTRLRMPGLDTGPAARRPRRAGT
jgi:hypothetical protein